MPRRRLPAGNVILAVCAVASGSGSGDGSRRVVTGFSAAPQPQPSTSWGGQATSRTSTLPGLGTSSCRHRRRSPCIPVASGGFSRGGDGADGVEAMESLRALVVLRRLPWSRRSATALASRPPTAEEMDAEWEGILAGGDDDDDDDDDEDSDDDEDEEYEDDGLTLTDEELLAADATEGGYLGGAGEDGAEDDEEGGLGGGAGQGKRRRKPRVWYDSYKARMKAEKAKAAAWAEKRKTFSKAHNDYLDEAQRNREIAAARREKYTKKFYRTKKIYDIVKERGRKSVREATWATRWPRQVTRKLEDLKEGEWLQGKVRNVESYGAWVDVNAERDGLLHVKDMGETFTPTAGEVVATKDTVLARVKFVDAETGKLGLSLVEDGPREGDLPLPPPRPPISVADVSRGAELWGYVERVTNLGAYVNVGAEVPGFLLLKEIPGRPKGLSAPEVLRRNKRLRVYAREVDREGLRIKLTCKRPRSLPRCGPPSVLASDADTEEFDYDDTRTPVYADEDGWDRDDDDYYDAVDEEYDEEDEEYLEDDDDDEGEDWFYPDQGLVIPPPEVEKVASK